MRFALTTFRLTNECSAIEPLPQSYVPRSGIEPESLVFQTSAVTNLATVAIFNLQGTWKICTSPENATDSSATTTLLPQLSGQYRIRTYNLIVISNMLYH